MLVANDLPGAHQTRKYREPDFPVERSRAVAGKGSYTLRFQLRAEKFTRALCPDGKPVGNNGAGKVLKVDRKRIITWVDEEQKIRGMIKSKPPLSKARAAHPGVAHSTADVEKELEDFINEQRKAHRGCGNREVVNKLLELKPDAPGGLSAPATPEEANQFRAKFNNWYQRFRKWRGFGIRRSTSVGQMLPKGHEGMAWATLMKVRDALVKCPRDLRSTKPVCSWREPHRGEGSEFRAAGVSHGGRFSRIRQRGPDAGPGRDASGDNSREARCEGCSQQHRRCVWS